MGSPVVHFEIIGTDAPGLRQYYTELFDWQFDVGGPVAPEVSEAGNYGFVNPLGSDEGQTIPGGVGGGTGFAHHIVFYVGVPNVEAALRRAESLGGTRVMGPSRAPERDLVVAHFTDPEGNLIGLAGPA
ncbi:VOC family protein [Glaciihabitans sp. dw_435]|uniref:VOC family protein n=1 Tax=Glaciihabitans sp. dw_435 TaxID=2720081 RepID=UPI001BD4F05B|nr:VOC family protein [Glaciihabitans sp. dw_435]